LDERESYPVFLANEAESEASIIPEIERYMAILDKPLSYKLVS
jgi:uncharacterized protein (DUF885 family)